MNEGKNIARMVAIFHFPPTLQMQAATALKSNGTQRVCQFKLFCARKHNLKKLLLLLLVLVVVVVVVVVVVNEMERRTKEREKRTWRH